MLGLYTKKDIEKRLEEQFEVFIEYFEVQDDLIEDLQNEVDEMAASFDRVLAKTTELMVSLNYLIDEKSVKTRVSKKSSKK